jgi:DNA invertase Pin-like site-specific DNA recombinase
VKVGYARLSTGDPEGLTIEIQHDRLKAAGCQRIYSEVISGNAAHRPQWEALKQAIAEGQVTEVVAYRFDRLSRSWGAIGEVINLFSQSDAPRLTLTDDTSIDLSTTGGRTVAGVLASVAAGERERIVARSKAGLKKRFASGRRIKIPFGITKDPQGFAIVDRRPMLCTIDDKAEHSFGDVAEAIWTAWEATPTNYSAARFAMERFGITAFRGGSAVTWCMNPVLRGGLTSGRANRLGVYDVVTEGQFEPLIEPERHKAAAAAYLRSRADNNRPKGTSQKATPLSGKIRCACCGYSMTLHRLPSRPSTPATFRCRREGCELQGKRVKYLHLLEAVRQHFLSKPEALLLALQRKFESPAVDVDLEREVTRQQKIVQQLRDTFVMVSTDDIRRALDREEAVLAELQLKQQQPVKRVDPNDLIRWIPSVIQGEVGIQRDGDEVVLEIPVPKSDTSPMDGIKRLLREDVFQSQEESLVPLLVHHLVVNASESEIEVIRLG